MKLSQAAILACFFLSLSLDPARLNEQTTTESLTTYIRANHVPPEDYVISKFKDHDIVFLGEQHRIKHDVELVQNLIHVCIEQGFSRSLPSLPGEKTSRS